MVWRSWKEFAACRLSWKHNFAFFVSLVIYKDYFTTSSSSCMLRKSEIKSGSDSVRVTSESLRLLFDCLVLFDTVLSDLLRQPGPRQINGRLQKSIQAFSVHNLSSLLISYFSLSDKKTHTVYRFHLNFVNSSGTQNQMSDHTPWNA